MKSQFKFVEWEKRIYGGKMMNRTIPKIGAAVVNGTGGNFYGADKQKRLGTDS